MAISTQEANAILVMNSVLIQNNYSLEMVDRVFPAFEVEGITIRMSVDLRAHNALRLLVQSGELGQLSWLLGRTAKLIEGDKRADQGFADRREFRQDHDTKGYYVIFPVVEDNVNYYIQIDI